MAFLLGGLLSGPAAHAQQADSLAVLTQKLQQYGEHTLTEEIFLHLDRPTYTAGETMWLKAYAVDGTYHRPLSLSQVAYVEILDAQNHPVAQTQVAMHEATGYGSLVLPATLLSGRYQVRAYTSWMQNFSPAFYFHSSVLVINTFNPSGRQPVAAKPAAYDVQFFPEGGQLVANIPGRVAFKVVDTSGRSIAATGTVADIRGKTVASFQTLKYGLGSFAFTPTESGVAYQAVLKLPGGIILTHALPAVQAQGYVLRVQEASATMLRLTVQATEPTPGTGLVRLLGHAGQRVAVAVAAPLRAGQASFLVARQQLPAGITHFTVFDGSRKPVAERLYFRAPKQPLQLTGQADKATYTPRERVTVQLAAATATNASVAVYQLDSLSAKTPADISAYLLLAADLKGTVEDAGYYLRDTSAVGRAAADNLMLTQGWSRFRWAEVLSKTQPTLTHPAETNGPLVRVRLATAAGTPAANVGTYLSIPNRTGRFYYARTQANGLAVFEPKDFTGTQRLVVQTAPKEGGPYELSIVSPYSTQFVPASLTPWYPSTSLLPALTERHLQVQVQQAFTDPQPYRVPPSDSASVYGSVSEQYRLDDYTRFKVMEEVMREYVPGVLVRKHKDGFHFLNLDRPHQLIFQADPLILLDGVPVFRTDDIMAFDPLKVNKLNVIAARYYQGSQSYEGVVSYTTYKGDLSGFQLDPHALLEEYEGMQGQREFYAPRYESPQQQQSRLADLRNLLHWQPQVLLQPNQPQAISFYTSDQAGRYLVVTQGLANNGSLGSTSFTFEVKPVL
jgi:hypothetical protein